MKKKLACLLLALVFIMNVFVMVHASNIHHDSEDTVDLLSLVNRELDDALLEEFGTTNPLKIGEEPYTRFLNDFVDRHNERVQSAFADIGISRRVDVLGVNVLSISAFNAVNTASGTRCPGCGLDFTIPRIVTTWGEWGSTGLTRVAGTFPNQFIENQNIRHGLSQAIMNCCNILVVTISIRETR